jgi:putative ABC transport system permease protein
MLRLTVKSILANKARFLLTGVAVLLGVAFMAGTFVLTDTIKKSYDDLSANVYRGTDAVIRSERTTASTNQGATTRGTVSASLLATVRALPAVRVAEAQQVGIAVAVGHDGRLLDRGRRAGGGVRPVRRGCGHRHTRPRRGHPGRGPTGRGETTARR